MKKKNHPQKKLKPHLLIVHHGYPPEHEAGSEIYTQNIAAALAKKISVSLFYRTRKEQPEEIKSFWKRNIHYFRVKEPNENNFEFLHENQKVDQLFTKVINKINPEFVYFGHLNHLSLNLIEITKRHGAIMLFTLHDYWLRCARGQLINRNGKICEPQDLTKCYNCIQNKYTKNGKLRTITECKKLLEHRMEKILRIFQYVDYFIAPTHFLRQKFIDIGCPSNKILYRDYGFNTKLFENLKQSVHKQRIKSGKIIFGYCGMAIPSKGVDILIEAVEYIQDNYFNQDQTKVINTFKIQINAAQHVKFKDYYQNMQKKIQNLQHVEFKGPYPNNQVGKIFEEMDVLIIPSIWYENSPLVIHEAFQAQIPVITSNNGGMAELVKNYYNGLLFEQGSAKDLAEKMIVYIGNKDLVLNHGKNQPKVHTIEEDATFFLQLFKEIQRKKRLDSSKNTVANGYNIAPWRITFDTNPELCNFSCIMCETFSPYSSKTHSTNKIMPIKLIEKIVWNALPFGLEEIIPSTMGEPLLYPEFESIIKICEDTGIYLNLTTNGSFPRKPVEEWAKLLLPICSDIKISWNAITPKIQETIMKGSNNIRRIEVLDKFQQARDKLYKISGYYCRLTLQMTFMKKNLLEIPKMIRFAYDHNIDRIKGHQLWILSAEMEKQALNKDNASIQEWNQMVKEAHQINTKLAEMYGYELILENFNGLKKIDNETDTNTNLKNEKNLEFSNIPENWECPFLQKEAWIAWDGVFNICCAPDDLRQTFGKWGNANEHDFMELWNNNKLKTFAKNYKSNPICNECLMRRPIEPCQISNLKEKKVNFAPRKRLL